MDGEANNIIKDKIYSAPDLVPKQEFSVEEMETNVKTELTEECIVYDDYADNPEMIDIKKEELDGFLNPNESPTEDIIAKPNETNIQILYPNETIPKEGNIFQYFNEVDDPKAMLICTTCGYRTHYTGHMRVHVLRHKVSKTPRPPKFFECDDCEYVTKYKPNLKMHRRRHEKEREEFDKMPNEYINFRKPPYQIYVGRKSGEKPVQPQEFHCQDCGYKTLKTGLFRLHVVRHKIRKNKQKGMFTCEVCGYQTDRSTNLRLHTSTHKNTEGPSFDRQYDFLSNETFRCNTCDFQATSKRQLYSHNYLKHKKLDDPKWDEFKKCEFCDYQTNKPNSFSAHLKSHMFVRTENNMYKCPDCDFETVKITTLKVHMGREHNSDAVNMKKCEHCDYKTLQSCDLKKHSLSHKAPGEVQLAKCSECSYETLHKSNLNVHIKRLHRRTDELEMFECFNCDYQARFKFQLKQHVVIHQNQNTLIKNKCTECAYETRARKNLVRHIRRRHKKVDTQI